MVSEELILSIARVSASLASIFGIIILVMTIFAIKKLSSGSFRNLVITSAVFLFIVVLGVSAMTVYHFTDSANYESISKPADNIWYGLMIFALIFSCFESWRYGVFGRKLSEPLKRLKK